MFKRALVVVFILLAVAGGLYAKKPRIAIADFTDKVGGSYEWKIGEGISDMLATSLVKTGRYEMYERKKMDAILEEQKLGLTGLTTPESAAKMGKILGVQFVVIGSVNQFGQKQEGGSAFGVTINSLVARVGADIRIVNVESGRIMAAESGIGEESSTGISIDNASILPTNLDFGSQGFDQTIIGKATVKCVNDLGDKIGKTFGESGLEGKIIKVSGDKVYLNLGKDSGVVLGQLFNIMKKGEDMKDPDTGEVLGSEDTLVGMVKISEIKDKFCIADILEGKDKIGQNDMALMKK
jgi:curli biogenesis system outer membrane secretion channel CsgG